MKKILVLASVAGIALGCNKTEEVPGIVSDGTKSVSFETYLGSQTKGLSKDAFKMGDQFYTFGVKTGESLFDISTPKFTQYVFASKYAEVSHEGLDPKTNLPIWGYGNPAPWDDQRATFFAFSPSPKAGDDFGITNPTIADNSIPTLDFEVKGGYDPAITDLSDAVVTTARGLIKSQTDLLWAYSADNTKHTAVIALDFRHALSQVRFSVRGYHNTGLLRLNSVTLKNAKTKGKLKLAHDLSKSGDLNYLGGWAVATDPKNFAVNLLTDAVSAIPALAVGQTVPTLWPITDDDESLIMIPQELQGVQLEVRYAYSPDGTNWTEYESGTSMDFVLSALSSQWNPNKRYNYIINISPGMAITFASTVEDWDPAGGSVDMEYRKFDAMPKGGVVMDKDGAAQKFDLKEGDKITTSYTVGGATDWLIATDATAGTGVDRILNGTAITVTAANAGEWTLKANPYDALASDVARTGSIVIERAPYEKTLADGTKIKVKAGVSKFVIRQGVWTTMAANTVVYGYKLGAITTGLSGFTTVGYPNAFSSAAYATSALALQNEKPFRRFRVALKAANAASGGSFTHADGIAACALYSEPGAPAGTWRMARIGEALLINLNAVEINKVAGMTAIGNVYSTTHSVIDKTTPSNERAWYASAGALGSGTLTGNSYATMRCVSEEK